MANDQPRQVSPQELQLLARLAGFEIAPEQLERVAEQVATVLQSIGQLDAKELHDVEPAPVFPMPWKTE